MEKIYTVSEVREMRPASGKFSLELLYQIVLEILETRIVPKLGPNAGFHEKHCSWAAASMKIDGSITFSAAISPDEDDLMEEFRSLVEKFLSREPTESTLRHRKSMIVLVPAIGNPVDYIRIRLRILDGILAPAYLTAGSLSRTITLSPTTEGFIAAIPLRYLIWEDKKLLTREDIRGKTPLGRAFAEMFPGYIQYLRRHLPPRWPH